MLRSSIPTTIEIKADIDETCGPVRVDITQIHQLIMNLATNAYHAMQDNGGTLKVILQPKIIKGDHPKASTLIPGQYACLTISDTGTGMPADIVEKIFDPYFTTKDKEKGTGLGLSVVLGIVKTHNGAIDVTSSLSQGSAFTVYLPISEKTSIPSESVVDQINLRGNERILVVDDEEEIVFFLTEALKQFGYSVTGKTNSLEALKEFETDPGRFDLVITDLTMPDLNGFQLSQQIIKIRPEILIIMCTGFNENVNEKKAQSIGIKKFVFKPIDQDEIAEAIRQLMDGND